MITFSTFHVDPKKDSDAILKSNIKNEGDYSLLIDLMFRSASLFHPDCQRVVLTDYQTDLSYLDKSIKAHRIQVDPNRVPLMYSRLVAQVDYIRSNNFASDMVFLDSDILINSNLESLFKQDFDIALTIRDLEIMPVNWGVMLVSKNGGQNVINFFEKILTIFKDKYFTGDVFWRDQYALMDAIGRDNFFNRSSDVICVDGVKILLIPCDIYNFSPDNNLSKSTYSSIAFELSQKQIIHFKGERKKLMYPYWKCYLSHREQPGVDMLVNSIQTRFSVFSHMPMELFSKVVSGTTKTLGKVKRKVVKGN